MDHQHVAETIKQAWLHQDYDALEAVLADVLEWYEDPFEVALTSRDKVIERWKSDVAKQSELQVEVHVLDVVQERGYYASRASYTTQEGQRRQIDGVFVVHLDTNGKIIYFNQWWASDPNTQ